MTWQPTVARKTWHEFAKPREKQLIQTLQPIIFNKETKTGKVNQHVSLPNAETFVLQFKVPPLLSLGAALYGNETGDSFITAARRKLREGCNHSLYWWQSFLCNILSCCHVITTNMVTWPQWAAHNGIHDSPWGFQKLFFNYNVISLVGQPN